MAPGMMGGPRMGPPPRGGPGRRPGGPPPRGGRPGDHPLPPPDELPEKEFDLKQMEKESAEMIKTVFLTKENVSFQKNPGGTLNLSFGAETFEDIELVETFPFTEPYAFLSVRNPRNKTKEIGMIENLEKDFDPDTVKMIKEHLDLRYHMPRIEKIVQAKESGGYTHFTVQTDFGQANFSLRANSTCITALNEKRLIIQDSEGNRFEIPDKHKLSSRELKKIDVFL